MPITAFILYVLTILVLAFHYPFLAILVFFAGVDLGAIAGVLLALVLLVTSGFSFFTVAAVVHVALLARAVSMATK